MSSRADRRAQLRAFLAKNFLLSDAEFPFDDDTSLMAEGVVDSTGVLELILFLDEAFGVNVSDADATPRNLDSVRAILDYVERQQPIRK
ncbi:MAG: acyl carrier protein [Planctomycetes bacterium]|nr:acyl carrier protein [Planctomycetota bacterium]